MSRFRIGSVFGIELTVDWSWFIILFLLLWSFTAGFFPSSYPGLPSTTYLAMGVAATILFFGSLLAHEFSHALVARRRGVPVHGITLFVFGGVAQLRREAANPRDQALIAGVGPLTSMVLALIFAGAGWVIGYFDWGTAPSGVARSLASLNLMLALFNLLPGLPLDGGRLLYAAVWAITRNVRRAARIAAAGGQFIGLALAGLGVAITLFGQLISGLWLFLIGTLIRSMARSSHEQQLLRALMLHTMAAEMMNPHPETVTGDLSLHDLVDDHFRHGRHLGYPVVADGHALGVITLDDVKRVPREQWPGRTVGQTMVPADRVSVRADDTVEQVVDLLDRVAVHRVLVTKNGQLAGIITPADLTSWFNHTRRIREL